MRTHAGLRSPIVREYQINQTPVASADGVVTDGEFFGGSGHGDKIATRIECQASRFSIQPHNGCHFGPGGIVDPKQVDELALRRHDDVPFQPPSEMALQVGRVIGQPVGIFPVGGLQQNLRLPGRKSAWRYNVCPKWGGRLSVFDGSPQATLMENHRDRSGVVLAAAQPSAMFVKRGTPVKASIGRAADDQVAMFFVGAQNVKGSPMVEEIRPKLTVELGDLLPVTSAIFATIDVGDGLLSERGAGTELVVRGDIASVGEDAQAGRADIGFGGLWVVANHDARRTIGLTS